MDLLFYDVETANSNHGSICAVGWVLVRDSVQADEGYTLIDPQCSFSSRCVEVHGITKAMVKGAPTFAEYWRTTLAPLFAASVVVSHNAVFDITHTVQALANAGIQDPGIDYVDSLIPARKYISSPDHKLPTLAARIGHEYQAHNALEDARALYAVLDALRREKGFRDVPELLLRAFSLFSLDQIQPELPKEPVTVEAIDSRLADLRICITGDIAGYTKEEVEALIAAHGGKPTSAVSGKTDYLVVGTFGDQGPDFLSGKQKKAMELNAAGKNICFLSPAELFARMGEQQRPAPEPKTWDVGIQF